jgi:membrane protein DedA with SNARE-associated domain
MSYPHLVLASLTEVVGRYGYPGIAGLVFVEGVGIPAPGQTAIILGAVAAGRGHLNVIVVAVVAFLATLAGGVLGYLIGRFGGRRLVVRYGRYVGLGEVRLRRTEAFMGQHGAKIVAVARFIDGLRQLHAIVAGAAGMPLWRFVAYSAVGSAAWVATWTTAGYLASDHIQTVDVLLRRFTWYALAAVVIAGVAVVLWHRRRSHREGGS